jgi:hypothetical protein
VEDCLVLEDPSGALVGLVHVEISGARGRLGLAVRKGDDPEGVMRRRLLKIAEGVCQASGCNEVELTVAGDEDPKSWLDHATLSETPPASGCVRWRLASFRPTTATT